MKKYFILIVVIVLTFVCCKEKLPYLEQVWCKLFHVLYNKQIPKVDLRTMNYDRDRPPSLGLARDTYDPYVESPNSITAPQDISDLLVALLDSNSYSNQVIGSTVELLPDLRIDLISVSNDTTFLYTEITKGGAVFVAFENNEKISWYFHHFSPDGSYSKIYTTLAFVNVESKIVDIIQPYLKDSILIANIDSIKARRRK